MESVCRRVLCVDDESNVLEGFRRQLRRKFDLTTATSGPEGLALIREQGPFAAVVTDYSMPEMNGVEFLQQAHAIAPTMVAIMLTGRAELRIAVTALHEGHIFRFLQKPCPIDMLERAIDEALEQYRLVVSEQLLTAELRTLNAELEERVTQRTATIRRLHRFVTDLNGLDSLDLVADPLDHPPDLAIAALADRDLDLTLADPPDVGRRGRAVIELDAGLEASEIAVADRPLQPRPVGLRHLVARRFAAPHPGDMGAGHRMPVGDGALGNPKILGDHSRTLAE